MCSRPGPEDAPAERLFFALWPDDAVRRQLLECSRPLLDLPDGRPVAADNLHLTLAFLGRVDAAQRRCVEAMAAAVRGTPFALQLARVGYWPRPRVLWLAPVQTPPALQALAADLHRGAEACGLSLDARPYRAHVTLKRKLRQPPPVTTVPPVHWTVRRFALVRSASGPDGVVYTPLRDWPLTAEDEAGS